MYYEIYLDFYFLENLFVNSALLVLTGMVMKCRPKKTRMFLAALLGSVFSCLLVILPFGGAAFALILQLPIAALMVRVGWGRLQKKLLLRGILSVYLLSFLLGGVLQTLAGLCRLPLLLLQGAAFFLLGAFLILYRRVSGHTESLRTVTVTIHGENRTVGALYDTGNRLREPYSHRPVNIVEYAAVEGLLRENELFFLIPCRTVAGENHILKGMTAEQMIIAQGGEESVVKQPVLAFTEETLSSDGSYQMILHPDNSDEKINRED